MSDRARRKELQANYKQTQTEAGVYRLVNTANGKALVGSTTNLASMRSKMEFGLATNTTGGFDYRLHSDIRAFGIAAFTLEILEVLDITTEMTRADILRDLATLEGLWREKFDPALSY